MERKSNNNTVVKCERSYDSLEDNKMSSKTDGEKSKVSFIVGILCVTSYKYF